MRSKQQIVPYLLLLPALVLLLVFNLLPTIATLVESTFVISLRSGERVFAGFANFERIFNDPIFWKSLQVTVVFSLVVNPLQIALALGLSILINQRLPGIGIFRSIYLLPVAVSLNVTAIVWRLLLDKNTGMVNGILFQLGIERQPFLHSVDQALWSIILIASWIGVPLWSLFILAGLQNIPPPVLEAAKIDGANAWQSFTRVTLPLLRRVLAFVLVADTVANFLLFAPILLTTQGGPQLSTNLILYETYRRGFLYGDLGASAAMLSVMLLIVFVIVGIELYVLRGSD
ncbi:MAG: sugar ABC transporter permease [Chloroflexi bacterium]|nr:sugar ABC transporter permease [Chloroflexota bacterium]MCY3583632.1 sugar ABC transporter permease [Chloroflexota bacterium]MCY3715897.1 sugar ABC transporter permease [Chloroflexota bacterium]MDE2650068.1 sugar ABC transporter permease [Chloroflexota bacterium]MXX50949.1 sugar ABC transporter permease [Chloroflexota bacterium]